MEFRSATGGQANVLPLTRELFRARPSDSAVPNGPAHDTYLQHIQNEPRTTPRDHRGPFEGQGPGSDPSRRLPLERRVRFPVGIQLAPGIGGADTRNPGSRPQDAVGCD